MLTFGKFTINHLQFETGKGLFWGVKKASGKRKTGEKCRKRKSILSFIFVSFTSMSRCEQIGGTFVVIPKIERLWGEKYKKKVILACSSFRIHKDLLEFYEERVLIFSRLPQKIHFLIYQREREKHRLGGLRGVLHVVDIVVVRFRVF